MGDLLARLLGYISRHIPGLLLEHPLGGAFRDPLGDPFWDAFLGCFLGRLLGRIVQTEPFRKDLGQYFSGPGVPNPRMEEILQWGQRRCALGSCIVPPFRGQTQQFPGGGKDIVPR